MNKSSLEVMMLNVDKNMCEKCIYTCIIIYLYMLYRELLNILMFVRCKYVVFFLSFSLNVIFPHFFAVYCWCNYANVHNVGLIKAFCSILHSWILTILQKSTAFTLAKQTNSFIITSGSMLALIYTPALQT